MAVYPSLQSLRDRITVYYGSRGLPIPETLSPGERLTLPSLHGEDALLLGDAPLLFTDTNFWIKDQRWHFHVLCHSMKTFLVNAIGLPKDTITVVPRYELWPCRMALQHTMAASEYLVYGGRNLTHKHVPLAQKLAERLEKKFLCFGPDFATDLKENWISKLPPLSTVILLSHYGKEDFSVSIAEAQAAGLPVITTHWHGLKDVQGEGVHKLTPHLATLTPGFDEEAIVEKWLDELRHPPTKSHLEHGDDGRGFITSAKIRSIVRHHEAGLGAKIYLLFLDLIRNHGQHSDVWEHFI